VCLPGPGSTRARATAPCLYRGASDENISFERLCEAQSAITDRLFVKLEIDGIERYFVFLVVCECD
jgi:hypothetical protein